MRKILILAVLFSTSQLFAQNFVFNPSFEDTEGCPSSTGESVVLNLSNVPNWSNPTLSSPDYTNACIGANALSKTISFPPHTGSGYMRYYPHHKMPSTAEGYPNYEGYGYHEYVQGELCHKLEAGKQYELSFWAKMSVNERYGTNAVAINVSSSPLGTSVPYGDAIELTPAQTATTVFNPTSNIIGQTWVQVIGTITANGGEQFVTIGTFKNCVRAYEDLDPTLSGNSLYFFLDDVKVKEAGNDCLHTLWIEDKSYNTPVTESAGHFIFAGKDVGLPGVVGNVDILPGSQVEYIAGEAITLEPGFTANLSGINDEFLAHIVPNHCNSPTPPYVNAGEDIYIERCKTIPFPNIGEDCSGLSYEWSAEPAFALDWLINPNSCITPIFVPDWAWVDGITSVTYTLKVGSCVENYDQVTVHLTACKSLENNDIGDNGDSISSFKVYPNPNKGLFTLESDLQSEVSNVIITDIGGAIVWQGQITERKTEVSLINFSSGIYFVKLSTDSSTDIQKIIIQ